LEFFIETPYFSIRLSSYFNSDSPPMTLQSVHGFRRYPNLVAELAQINRPDQVWCCDITYVILATGEIVYLAIVLPKVPAGDVFTRCIRGWELSQDITHELTVSALKRALKRYVPDIHHSDQGVQLVARMGYMRHRATPSCSRRTRCRSA
jgi:putative transposase